MASNDVWLTWLSNNSKMGDSFEDTVYCFICFKTSIKISDTIQPVRDDSPLLPTGAPFKNSSLNRTRGNTNTGGKQFPMAFMMPQNVTSSPLSALTICPICRFFVSPITCLKLILNLN